MVRLNFRRVITTACLILWSLIPRFLFADSTWEDIESRGLSNACYPDQNHHVAEFLFQNPDVCFWSATDSGVRAEPVPVPPADAVALPPPSGGDDTAALESVINANSRGVVVGSGTYRVRDLDITVTVDIHGMAMIPAGSGTARMVNVHAPDVRIFDSPIDAGSSRSTYVGFDVADGAHGFTLVRSGVSNLFNRSNRNASGVRLKGVDDFHLACNTFDNIVSTASDRQATARANAIWMNGRKRATTSGGVIANNNASELQSNGSLSDSEFLTIQSYVSTDVDRPVKIFANRAVNAGKRFTKHQESNALVLSNSHEWNTKQGPLGPRKLLAHVEVKSANNVIARNNRVKISAGSRFDYVFFANQRHSVRQDNLHYDCNDVEIQDRLAPGSRATPRVISTHMIDKSRASTGYVATNSSARNNVIRGAGSLRYHYSFGAGYPRQGGAFDISGNRFEVPYTHSEFR